MCSLVIPRPYGCMPLSHTLRSNVMSCVAALGSIRMHKEFFKPSINSYVELLYPVIHFSLWLLDNYIWCQDSARLSLWSLLSMGRQLEAHGDPKQPWMTTAHFLTTHPLGYSTQHRHPSQCKCSLEPMGMTVECLAPFWCSWKQRHLQSWSWGLWLVPFADNDLQQFPMNEAFFFSWIPCPLGLAPWHPP